MGNDREPACVVTLNGRLPGRSFTILLHRMSPVVMWWTAPVPGDESP